MHFSPSNSIVCPSYAPFPTMILSSFKWEGKEAVKCSSTAIQPIQPRSNTSSFRKILWLLAGFGLLIALYNKLQVETSKHGFASRRPFLFTCPECSSLLCCLYGHSWKLWFVSLPEFCFSTKPELQVVNNNHSVTGLFHLQDGLLDRRSRALFCSVRDSWTAALRLSGVKIRKSKIFQVFIV